MRRAAAALAATLCCRLAAAQPAQPAPVALSLRDAVEQGLRQDPLVLSALVAQDRSQLAVLRAQLDRISLQADASLQEQWTTNYPNPVTVGVDGVPRSQYPQTIGLLNATANLRVPVFSGFRVSANVQKAQLGRQAASAQLQAARRQAAVDVLRSYWAVRSLDLQLAVSVQSLERLEEMSKVVAARVRAGLAPAVEQNRTEVRRQREIARLRDLEGQAAETRAQLAVLLGLNGAPLTLTEEADVPSPPPATVDEVDRLLGGARQARPELLQARYQTMASLQDVRIARSAYYPQLNGQALLQFGNNPFNPATLARNFAPNPNPFEDVRVSLFLGASLSINLFDTLTTYTNVKNARFEVARLQQEERRLGRLVESEVRTLHARLLRLYSAREPLQRARELARDTVDVIERRYRNGDALIIDFLEAQVDLTTSEVALANSAASIATAWGELSAATGRLPGKQ